MSLFAICACISVPATAAAQDEQGRLYFRADLGGNYTPDTDLKEFFGPVDPGSRVKFDPGFRFGLHGGYNVTDWVAPELEVGIMENWIKSITGASRVHDATFMNVPVLVNVKFQWLNASRVTPYIGGGVGVSSAVLDADQITVGDVSMHGSQATAVFAYQGFAGLRFNLNKRMSAGLEYRYFATDEPEWRADFAFNVPSDKVKFGGIQTHAASLIFNYTF